MNFTLYWCHRDFSNFYSVSLSIFITWYIDSISDHMHYLYVALIQLSASHVEWLSTLHSKMSPSPWSQLSSLTQTAGGTRGGYSAWALWRCPGRRQYPPRLSGHLVGSGAGPRAGWLACPHQSYTICWPGKERVALSTGVQSLNNFF